MLVEELVVRNEIMGGAKQRICRMVLKGPVAREAKPGQFVHIQVSTTNDPLLRRPISISAIDEEREEIILFYRVQGKGTELLARAVPGQMLSVMGPLGSGFSLPGEGELCLVAGGIGSFPLYALAEAAQQLGLEVHLFWGGENREFLASAGLKLWQELGISLHLSTLDGSLGTKGLVSAPFQEYIENKASLNQTEINQTEEDSKNGQGHIHVAACGPAGMLKAVSRQCQEAGLPLEVSLEERMGCAVGACLGCVATLRNQSGDLRRAKVCKDGPVFPGEEVVWDATC